MKAYTLGIPEWLARLEDCIFEGLSKKRSKKWPLEFSDAINIGADLNKIKIPFIVFILEQNILCQEIQLHNLNLSKNIKKIIKDVIKVNKKMITAQISKNKELILQAKAAAWSAARSAAAWSEWSAESAARSAARSAAAWSAESTTYKLYADKILKLIKEID